MNIIVWLVVGGLIGWLASLFMGTDARQGILLNVAVGIVGAVLGGWLLGGFVGAGSINQGDFSMAGLLVSFLGAVILLAGPNFGTGSSREHAVWAIQQYGFEAVVSPRFGDIFRNNCTKNGLVPVEVDAEIGAALLTAIDLYGRDNITSDGTRIEIGMAERYGTERRVILLHGPVGSSKSTIARLRTDTTGHEIEQKTSIQRHDLLVQQLEGARQEHAAHDVQLPQRHRGVPLPAAVLVAPPPAGSRRHQATDRKTDAETDEGGAHEIPQAAPAPVCLRSLSQPVGY